MKTKRVCWGNGLFVISSKGGTVMLYHVYLHIIISSGRVSRLVQVIPVNTDTNRLGVRPAEEEIGVRISIYKNER